MKLSVRVRGEWLAIPCKGGETVAWLGEEALKRYKLVNPQYIAKLPQPMEVQAIRKTKGGALLYQHDNIKSVLDDNDFVSVGECCKKK